MADTGRRRFGARTTRAATKPEIVVLIRKGDRVLGQIDVDSHSLSAFDEGDEEMLDEIARLLSGHW